MFDLLSAAKVKDNMQGGWAGGMKEEMTKEERKDMASALEILLICNSVILKLLVKSCAPSLVVLVVSSLHPAARLEPALQLSTLQHYITRLHHKPPSRHFAASPPRHCHPTEEMTQGQSWRPA